MMQRWKIYLILLALACLLLQYQIWFGNAGILSSKELENNVEKTMQTIKNAQLKNRKIKDEIQFYEDNPKAYESLAREQLGLTYKHEKLIQIRGSFADKTVKIGHKK